MTALLQSNAASDFLLRLLLLLPLFHVFIVVLSRQSASFGGSIQVTFLMYSSRALRKECGAKVEMLNGASLCCATLQFQVPS